MNKSRGTQDNMSNVSLCGEDDADNSSVPKPSQFCSFLPWACQQYFLPQLLIIIRRDLYEKPKEKSRTHTKELHDVEESDTEMVSASLDTIILQAIYSGDYLVQIKMCKNKCIPRKLLKILGMAVPYHPKLESITINSGVDVFTCVEIGRFLPKSNITEICLDNTFFAEANYDVLLDRASSLKHLSLARCRIEDKVLKKIAEKLEHPKPAGKTLIALNLSSNRITDTGAGYLAATLRTNRRLSYLNLSSNHLTSDGAMRILDALRQFHLTEEETMGIRRRYIAYINHRNAIVEEIIKGSKEPRQKELTEKQRKSVQVTVVKKSDEQQTYKLAVDMANKVCGEFKDPIGTKKDTTTRDGILFSKGNNILAYLNLSYNSIDYQILKCLIDVIRRQKMISRTPQGLLSVNIEGNPIPAACPELVELEHLLQMNLLRVSMPRPPNIRKSSRLN